MAEPVTYQRRVVCAGKGKQTMCFVQGHKEDMFALHGQVETGSITTTKGVIRQFDSRFTTLDKIKQWAEKNKMSVQIEEKFPVHHNSYPPED